MGITFTKRPNRYRYRASGWLGRAFVTVALTLFSVACVVPLLLILSASFTTEAAITTNGYTLWPSQFTTAAYAYILSDPSQILRAYGVTLTVTMLGTGLGLPITAMLAYALSRPNFAARRALSFYVFFTLLFNGGLIPFYLFVVQTLKMKDNLLILIPLLVNGWNVLILRTSFAQLPEDLLDAARIDGAGEFRIFWQVVVPISTPVLATVGLFMMLAFWNDWWMSLLFISNKAFYSIQFLLYNINASIQAIQGNPEILARFGGELPAQSARMALALLAIGPIAFVYLFLQRYLIRGITIGSIK